MLKLKSYLSQTIYTKERKFKAKNLFKSIPYLKQGPFKGV